MGYREQCVLLSSILGGYCWREKGQANYATTSIRLGTFASYHWGFSVRASTVDLGAIEVHSLSKWNVMIICPLAQ